MTLPAPITDGPVPPRAIPRASTRDPRPPLVLGAVASFLCGFVPVAVVMVVGYKIARRWIA